MWSHKNIIWILVALISMGGLTSCSDELSGLDEHPIGGDGIDRIVPVIKMFSPIQVTTRGDNKTEPEKKITSLHLFIFDSDGNYLACTQGSQNYQYISNGAFTLNREFFVDQQKAQQATACVVANLPQDMFALNDAPNGQIANLTDLHHYLASSRSFQIPDAGLILYGEKVLDLHDNGNKGESFQVELKSLFARIDFNLTMNPAYSLGSYPSFTMTSYDLHHLPSACPVEETTTESAETLPLYDAAGMQISGNTTLIKGQSTSFTFYMLEHKLDAARTTPESGYPAGISDDAKQRYKPALAKENATYVVIHGLYTDIHEMTYRVSFKVYLGANSTNDFNVLRNCQYKNNIAITGITNHDGAPTGSISFDHRVNVQNDKFIVSIERETELDCHIEVRPMDVYLGKPGSKVEFEILDPTGVNKWFRMEQTEKEQNYFLTDLLGKLQTAATIEDNTNNRVWFYFDEYTDISKASTTGYREGTVRMKYYDPGATQPTEITDYKFRQHTLFPVTYDGRKYYMEYYEEYLYDFDPKNPYGNTEEGMEWGLNGITVSDSIQSIEIGSTANWFDNYKKELIAKISPHYDFDDTYDGLRYTKKIINKSNSFTLPLNDLPRSAAEYCYNKNKRSSNGTVADKNVKWYLPAIGEIEDICMGAYSSFSVFQDLLYWSSQPAYENWDFECQYWLSSTIQQGVYRIDNTDNARATKVSYIDGTYGTVKSGATGAYKKKKIVWSRIFGYSENDSEVNQMKKDPGYLPRTQKNRVRAIYHVE